MSPKRSKCLLRYPPDTDLALTEQQFDTAYWKTRPGSEVFSSKRGESVRFMLNGQDVILRHYYRGGIIRKIITDQYLWLGRSMSRPWREWSILDRAADAGLPVPRPVAACVCRNGIYYRAAIITSFFADTQILAERLRGGGLKRKSWYQLGVLIKRLQAQGIRHADLNASNILVDQKDRFYIIDFDKARIMNHLADWQWQPLFRLQRSLDKFNRDGGLRYSADEWQSLMDGYQS